MNLFPLLTFQTNDSGRQILVNGQQSGLLQALKGESQPLQQPNQVVQQNLQQTLPGTNETNSSSLLQIISSKVC